MCTHINIQARTHVHVETQVNAAVKPAFMQPPKAIDDKLLKPETKDFPWAQMDAVKEGTFLDTRSFLKLAHIHKHTGEIMLPERYFPISPDEKVRDSVLANG